MDKNERKRLKKLGRQQVELRSQQVRAALAAANPAPIASDEWAANYRDQSLRERELRKAPPDYIAPDGANRDWVILPVDESPTSKVSLTPTLYFHCGRCGALLHSFAASPVICECGNIQIRRNEQEFLVRDYASVRLVKLLARAKKKSFWSRLFK